MKVQLSVSHKQVSNKHRNQQSRRNVLMMKESTTVQKKATESWQAAGIEPEIYLLGAHHATTELTDPNWANPWLT